MKHNVNMQRKSFSRSNENHSSGFLEQKQMRWEEPYSRISLVTATANHFSLRAPSLVLSAHLQNKRHEQVDCHDNRDEIPGQEIKLRPTKRTRNGRCQMHYWIGASTCIQGQTGTSRQTGTYQRVLSWGRGREGGMEGGRGGEKEGGRGGGRERERELHRDTDNNYQVHTQFSHLPINKLCVSFEKDMPVVDNHDIP